MSAQAAFQKANQFWSSKFKKQGAGFTARSGEDMKLQTARIEDLLLTRLTEADHFEDGLDFGCGCGRFIEFLSNYCDHVWGADVLAEVLEAARAKAANVSAIHVTWPPKLPPHIDLLLGVFIFQHLIDDSLFAHVAGELRKVLSSGARVLIIDNAIDVALHVKPRGHAALASVLGLRPDYHFELVTINNRPSDHWLIDGIKA